MLKASQIAAKAVVRLFLFLLLLATLPFLQGDNAKLAQLSFIIHTTWVLIFPALLLVGFFYFFISCTINKYKSTDLNILLVVNTLVLMAYGVAVYIRIFQVAK